MPRPPAGTGARAFNPEIQNLGPQVPGAPVVRFRLKHGPKRKGCAGVKGFDASRVQGRLRRCLGLGTSHGTTALVDVV